MVAYFLAVLEEYDAGRCFEAGADAKRRLEAFLAWRDELGELRAPRPFTIEAAAPQRGGLGRLELATRVGAVMAAVAFAVVLTGDLAGLGDDDGAAEERNAPTAALQAATASSVTAVLDDGVAEYVDPELLPPG